jgi:hypothetical protein
MNTNETSPSPIKRPRSEELIRNAEEVLNRIKKILNVIIELAQKIDELDLKCHWFGDSLDFDNLKHNEVMKVILAFPGEWKKELNSTSINYTCKYNDYTIRCWMGEPPPSCKIEEYTEVQPSRYVPESVVIKHRLICPKTSTEGKI